MSEMIQRKLRLSIQIGDDVRVYSSEPGSQFDISAVGKKTSDQTKNKFTVSIANIQQSARNYLLDMSSTYDSQREPHFVQIEAGTTQGEYSIVFTGYITGATATQPPDTRIVIEAMTGAYNALDVSTLTYSSPVTPLSVISRDVAKILGLDLRFEATEQQIKNWQHANASSLLVSKLNQIMGVDAYVDDSILTVKNTGTGLRGLTNTLSLASGMIGHPTQTELGCMVISTFNSSILIGSIFNLITETNPALNGEYEVFEIDYNLTTRASDFNMTINAKRVGINNKRLTPTESAVSDTELLLSRTGGTDSLTRKLIPASSPSSTTNPTSSIMAVMHRHTVNMATQMPAVVLQYDRNKNVAKVQGLLMLKTSDGGAVPQVAIAEVPVLAYGTSSVAMTFPIEAGDIGWIEASAGDISAFMESLDMSPVPTSRTFDWGDSRFIPDAFRKYTLAEGVNNAFALQSSDGATYISLESGTVRIVSSNKVVVTAPDVAIESTNVTINADKMTFTGGIVDLQSDVNVSGTLNIAGKVFNDHYHLYDGNKKTSDPKNA